MAGISVRRVEDISQALRGTRVSPSTVSSLNKKVYGRIEQWLNGPLTGRCPYVFMDGVWLKRSWGGEVKNVSVLVAVGVDEGGFRQVFGVREGAKDDKESRTGFLCYLKGRGLPGWSCLWTRSVWVSWSPWPSFNPRPGGNSAWCIFTGTFHLVPKGKVKQLPPCSRPSMPRRTVKRPVKRYEPWWKSSRA